MTLTVNGQPQDYDAATLDQLVDVLGLADAKVATALNGSFVPARKRQGVTLNEGDRVEIVAPMQGG